MMNNPSAAGPERAASPGQYLRANMVTMAPNRVPAQTRHPALEISKAQLLEFMLPPATFFAGSLCVCKGTQEQAGMDEERRGRRGEHLFYDLSTATAATAPPAATASPCAGATAHTSCAGSSAAAPTPHGQELLSCARACAYPAPVV